MIDKVIDVNYAETKLLQNNYDVCMCNYIFVIVLPVLIADLTGIISLICRSNTCIYCVLTRYIKKMVKENLMKR